MLHGVEKFEVPISVLFMNRSLSSDDLRDMDLNFDFSKQQLDSQIVTTENLEDYIKYADITTNFNSLYAETRSRIRCEKQFEALSDEVFSMIPPKTFDVFGVHPADLSSVISGENYISLKDWKQNTMYADGFSDVDSVKYFWQYVETLDQQQRGTLLYFITGSRYPPAGGFANLRGDLGLELFEILPAKNEGIAVSTCFNRLHLPEYQSFQELKTGFDEVLSYPFEYSLA